MMERINQIMKEQLRRFPDLFVTNLDSAPQENGWAVRMESVGPRILTAKEVTRLEEEVSQLVDREVTITLWFKSEALVTSGGYSSTEEFTRKRLQERAAEPGS